MQGSLVIPALTSMFLDALGQCVKRSDVQQLLEQRSAAADPWCCALWLSWLLVPDAAWSGAGFGLLGAAACMLPHMQAVVVIARVGSRCWRSDAQHAAVWLCVMQPTGCGARWNPVVCLTQLEGMHEGLGAYVCMHVRHAPVCTASMRSREHAHALYVAKAEQMRGGPPICTCVHAYGVVGAAKEVGAGRRAGCSTGGVWAQHT